MIKLINEKYEKYPAYQFASILEAATYFNDKLGLNSPGITILCEQLRRPMFYIHGSVFKVIEE